MNDVAGPVAEDRVELVLPFHREAARAALLQAVELFITEIPAARPLHDVAANSSDIADLRRANAFGGGHQCREQLARRCMLGEVDDLGGRADAQSTISGRDRLIETFDRHDAIRRNDVVLHEAEEVHAARHRQHLAALG